MLAAALLMRRGLCFEADPTECERAAVLEDAGFNPNWSRSSHGQDKSIARIFAYMRHGYFVDLGANHAEFDSNTFALERHMNWTGLCVEPNPRYWAGYEGRTCQVFKAVVGRNDGDEVPFALRHQNSGIVGEHFDNSLEQLERVAAADAGARAQGGSPEPSIIRLRSRSLSSILEEANAPATIDYLSIDVEGAEHYILAEFPFDRYRFRAITVERPRKLRSVLEANGYVYVKDHGTFGDELYLLRDSLPNFAQIFGYYHIAKPLAVSERGWAIPRQKQHPDHDFIVIFDAVLCRGQGGYPWEGPKVHVHVGGFHKDVLYEIDVWLQDVRGVRAFYERAAVLLPEDGGHGVRRDEVSIEMPLELEVAAGVEGGLYDLRVLVQDATEGLDYDQALLALKVWNRAAFGACPAEGM